MIHSGENGIVVERGRPDEMAEALHRLITDASLRKKLGAANLAKSEYYGWDHISCLYLEHE